MSYEVNGPRITAFGGGTGLATLLRGLKQYTENITAVVTVADDGGGSGIIRQELGILPPGDIRNCILALANVEPVMERLLQYRFKEGSLKGQNFGNLLIAAMTDLSNGFEQAIKQISSVLAVTGKVLPVSLENLQLAARLEDGTLVTGESQIPCIQIKRQSPIKEVFIDPPDAKPLPEVLEAIRESDVIAIGPGSLYTSIIPILLLPDICSAICSSQAKKVYIANIMTQPGETTGYTLCDHLNAIIKHGGEGLVEYVIVNNQLPSKEILDRYANDESTPVCLNEDFSCHHNMIVKEDDFIHLYKGLIRHNPNALARSVLDIYNNHAKEGA